MQGAALDHAGEGDLFLAQARGLGEEPLVGAIQLAGGRGRAVGRRAVGGGGTIGVGTVGIHLTESRDGAGEQQQETRGDAGGE